ncbi:hypothetical protein LPTSP4_34870 [Leptospira ryugenii]|uniref:DUF304 domain-containing protein n=1 Tax=Leptospira ryugenii TaxID=1917863 RepID=A0A2P2E4Z5_9LEPT|nr:hypothetical protein [Leptospira ryugenii]GBF51949.1 hypothetical protein LPTSP4_34870 [Leptospira ryugenii]
MKWFKQIISRFRERQIRKRNSYFGTSLYEPLVTNNLPQWTLFLFCTILLYLLFQNIHYLSDFLYWFVSILEITKVLKIPFLNSLKYYQYLALFVYFYLAFSLVWDLSQKLMEWDRKLFLVKEEIWVIERRLFGVKLHKFNRMQDSLELEWLHSGIRNWLGFNQLVWKRENQIIAKSPFFFPYRNNQRIINQLLQR